MMVAKFIQFIGLALVMASCVTGAPSFVCVDNGDCQDGQACILEQCQDVQCLASDQCNLQEYCDTTTYTCRVGCNDDLDCKAGQSCNVDTNTCEDYGCRDTQLDCSIGYICNTNRGECEYAHDGHCDKCDGLWDLCANPSAACLTFDGIESFCFEPCNISDVNACPRGYVCQNVDAAGGNMCMAYCPTLYDNGWKN